MDTKRHERGRGKKDKNAQPGDTSYKEVRFTYGLVNPNFLCVA